MSERLDFQAWMKPEATWHLAPRAFSSYSWPAAAVSIKAGVQAAVVGPWLNPGTEWGGIRCSTIAVFFSPGRWDPSQCDYLPWGRRPSGRSPLWRGLQWQDTAGKHGVRHGSVVGRSRYLHGSGASPALGIGATHSSSRGAASQPGNSHGHPVVSLLESG